MTTTTERPDLLEIQVKVLDAKVGQLQQFIIQENDTWNEDTDAMLNADNLTSFILRIVKNKLWVSLNGAEIRDN